MGCYSIFNLNADEFSPILPLLNLAHSIPSNYYSQKYPTANLISEDRSHLAHAPRCHGDRFHEPHSQTTHVVAYADGVTRNV